MFILLKVGFIDFDCDYALVLLYWSKKACKIHFLKQGPHSSETFLAFERDPWFLRSPWTFQLLKFLKTVSNALNCDININMT